MSNALPKITVITPVLNAATVIDKAINSVLQQNYPDLEYIVVDAFSNDGTKNVIEKYRSHLTLIQQHDNGPGHAYNFAIQRSHGEIIAMLSADDWLEDGILREVGTTFSADSTLEMVSARTRLVKQQETGYTTMKEFNVEDIEFTLPKILRWPLTNARFFHKSLFQRFGCFNVFDKNGGYNIPADTDLLIKLALNRIHTKSIGTLGYTFLCHENSLTTNSNLAKKNIISQQLLHIYEAFLSQELAPDDRKFIESYHAKELLAVIFRCVRQGDVLNLTRYYHYAIKRHKLKFLKHMIEQAIKLVKK